MLLTPGENCWRIENARRAAWLVDNARYFQAVESALQKACRSVLLLGWEFDPRTRLTADESADHRIGALLTRIAQERRGLDIRVLIWAATPPIALALDGMPWRAHAWFRGTSVRFVLDATTPRGACHHQKVVVVDDAVAFCSGSDFMPNRWDRARHADREPARRLPNGKPSAPRHAASIVVDGRVASALGELARERWREATGEALSFAAPESDPWPEGVTPDLTDTQIAIARTQPEYHGRPGVHEGEALFIDAIASATDSLYIENQYFASQRIADALMERIARDDAPEVVVVCSASAPNLFDRLTMDPARDRLVARLRAADRARRLAVYAPYTNGGQEIVVHSKVMIADRHLLRIGSANINNRSMGFDTECDLVMEDATHSEAIEGFRDTLVAHFLGRTRDEVSRKVQETGSLIRCIEALDVGSRRLRPLQDYKAGPLRRLIAGYHLGDPNCARDAWRPWRRR